MEQIISILKENNSTLFLAMTSAAFYILLGLDDDIYDVKYLKKFNVLCYILLGFLLAIFPSNTITIILIFVFIFFISSLNMLEYANTLEKSLSKRDLIAFSLIKWFYHTKIYIFIFFALLVLLVSNTSNNGSYIFILLIIGIVYHQLSFTKDFFGYFDFNYLKERLLSVETFSNYTSEELNNAFSILSYVIYIEDKDFFNRNNLHVELKPIYNRKKKTYNPENTKSVQKMNFLHTLKLLIHRYKRGYSTIGMQVVRSVVLKPDSYRYRIRCKILIEIFYTNFFKKAYINMLSRYNKKAYREDKERTLRNINAYINVLVLQYYYFIILNEPKTLEDFLNIQSSRLTDEILRNKYEEYISDEYNIYYEKLIFRELSNSKKINS